MFRNAQYTEIIGFHIPLVMTQYHFNCNIFYSYVVHLFYKKINTQKLK